MIFRNTKWFIFSAVFLLTVFLATFLKNNINKEVIAKINGKEITQNDFNIALLFEQQKYKYQVQKYEDQKQFDDGNIFIPVPQKLSPQQILERLIDNEVLYQEAKSQGLEVSYAEAKEYMEETRKITNEILAGKLQVADREEFLKTENNLRQYIKGLGISEDEYWNQLIPIYQKYLSIGKLKAKILSSMPENDKKDPEKAHLYFEQYKNNLRKKYKIEIFKNNL
ncbi:MAG: SurA N-terminal domain-containing protein [Thermovenabulum sp.]|uniref:SurA N-terminal domain-containing protein n=1 Tax=Thermovenabulum sp. TaxID=3100335 RepID=UPI003C7C9D2B